MVIILHRVRSIKQIRASQTSLKVVELPCNGPRCHIEVVGPLFVTVAVDSVIRRAHRAGPGHRLRPQRLPRHLGDDPVAEAHGFHVADAQDAHDDQHKTQHSLIDGCFPTTNQRSGSPFI